MKKVIGYVRVSTIMQSQTLALEQQKARIESYGVDEVLCDVESGARFDRESFLNLTNQIEKGTVDTVVVTRLDRIGRTVIGIKHFIDLCSQHEVRIIALDQSIDNSTSAGRFQINILASLGEMELDQIKERTMHGHAHYQKKQLPYKSCFGYVKENGKLIIDRDPFLCLIDDMNEISKGDIAREMVDLFLEFKTMRAVINAIHTKYGGKVGLSIPQSISKWLCNPTLRGYVCYGRGRNGGRYNKCQNWDIRDKLYEAIITEKEWQEIETVFRKIAKNKNTYRRGRYCHPFGSLLKCKRCGSSAQPLLSGKKRKSIGYQCINYKYNMCDNKKWVRDYKVYELVDLALQNRAKELVEDLNYNIESEPSDEEKKIKAELESLSTISNSSSIIQEAIENLKLKLAQLKRERASESTFAKDKKERLIQVFQDPDFFIYLKQSLSKTELREFYRRFVDKIIFDDGNVLEVILSV